MRGDAPLSRSVKPFRLSLLVVLVTVAIAMASACLFLLIIAIQEADRARSDFRGTLSSYGTQLDYELLQLIDHISRFSQGDATVAHTELLARYGTLLERVEDGPGESRTMEFLKLPEANDLVTDLRDSLARIKPVLVDMPPNSPGAAADTLDLLRSISIVAHRVAIRSIEHDAVKTRDLHSREVFRTRLAILLLGGFLGFVALSLGYALYEARRYRALSATLEKRVQKRTEEVSSVNASLAREITERRHSQHELALREKRLSQATRLAKLGYYVWDASKDRCVFCSEQHARAFGLSPEEFIRRSLEGGGLMESVHPDDRAAVVAAYEQLRSGETIDFEYRVITPDGTRRLREIAQPMREETGQAQREIATSLDTTEQFETERKLAATQRLEAIGQLTGGVAHDFNNIMAVILGNIETLQDDISAEERQQVIDDTIRSVLRGRDLTRDMLAFARQSTLVPVDVDVNETLVSFGAMIRRLLPSSIEIGASLDSALWPVTLDKSSFEAAVLNLAINARDAMPEGGSLTIESANLQVDASYLHPQEDEAKPGRYVMVALTDTGGGIPADVLPRIFEPFFTTKEAGQGSGLGLSMVQGFVKQSGGFMRIETEEGHSTSVRLFFPATERQTQAVPELDPPPRKLPSDAQGVRILLVEDEDAVRKVIATGLKRSGFEVVEAIDSRMAEKKFAQDGPFDLLLTDIVMPGELQGTALAKRLREKEPDLPTIFMSGYPNDAMLHGDGVRSDDVRMMKPVRRGDLINAIRKVLDLP